MQWKGNSTIENKNFQPGSFRLILFSLFSSFNEPTIISSGELTISVFSWSYAIEKKLKWVNIWL